MKPAAAALVPALLLSLLFGTAWAQQERASQKNEGPGLKKRVDDWVESQSYSLGASYSEIVFEQEAFQEAFHEKHIPLIRLGWGWFPVKNLSIEFRGGALHEVGPAIGAITGEDSGEDMKLYVYPLQASLSYEFNFLEDQLLVPRVWAGVDWWYFEETNEFKDNVVGDKTGHHWGADIGILLDPADPGAAHKIKQTFGVENSYLTIGYEETVVGEEDEGLLFSGSLISVGVRLETSGR